jgi:hypothetical protein
MQRHLRPYHVLPPRLALPFPENLVYLAAFNCLPLCIPLRAAFG